jgi:hypothetical protein
MTSLLFQAMGIDYWSSIQERIEKHYIFMARFQATWVRISESPDFAGYKKKTG